jgi:hypothetical protein
VAGRAGLVDPALQAVGVGHERERDLGRQLGETGAVLLEPPDGRASPANQLAFQAERAEELLPWLTQWVQGRGLSLERLSVEEATLEGAFLGMIGDAAENSDGKAPSAPAPNERLPPSRAGEVP